MDNNQLLDQSENLPQRLLTVNEFAFRLHSSRSFAYNLIMSGVLPVIKIGKSRRVQLQDLNDYISRNRSSSNNY